MAKKGLGRGLNSLFGDYNLLDEEVKNDSQKVVEAKEVVKEVPTIIEKEVIKTVVKEVPTTKPIEVEIGLIDRNPAQPRHIFDEKALSELSQSIKSHGVIQPLIVTANGDRYTGYEDYEAMDLLEALEAGELSGELKTIAEGLKEDDNPVLMVVKFKE